MDLTRLLGVLTVVVVLITWYVVTVTIPLLPSLFFPSPPAVLQALTALHATIVEHSLVTLYRVIVSFTVGSLIGVIVGLLMSRSRIVYAILDPLIEALRPVPPIALIPFFILWFGIGNFGKLLLSGLGCFMVLVVNTVVAVRNVPPIYIRAAASLGADNGTIHRTIIVPAIIPSLVSGWRVASALAFALTVAAELMGAQSGLGFLVMVARRSLQTDVILLSVIILTVEAWFVDRAIRIGSNLLTPWMERLGETK
jgi:ABC-type nitrate/sulfonate/bicarbonate transport system permease component